MKPLAPFLEKNFNSLNQIPKLHWLIHERESDHEERMHILGNVVVPSCAALAAEILRGLVAAPEPAQ